MTIRHRVYKVGKRYIVVNCGWNPTSRHFKVDDVKYSLQEQILDKLKIKSIFIFNTMGGMYRMEGVMNARKYFADNKFAKLYRVADGIELKVQKAKKEIRRELRNGVRNKGEKD